MKVRLRRVMSMVLAILMVLTMLPVQAFAVEKPDSYVVLPIASTAKAAAATVAADAEVEVEIPEDMPGVVPEAPSVGVQSTVIYASTAAISTDLPKITVDGDVFGYDEVAARVQAFDSAGAAVAQTRKITIHEWTDTIYSEELYFFDLLPAGEYDLKLVYGDVQDFETLDLPYVLKVVDDPVIIGGWMTLFAGTSASELSLTIAGYEGDADQYTFSLIGEEGETIPCTATHLKTSEQGYGAVRLTYTLTPSSALEAEAWYELKISVSSGELYASADEISTSVQESTDGGFAILEVKADETVVGGLQVKVGGVSEKESYTIAAVINGTDLLYEDSVQPTMVDGNGVFSIVLKKNGLALPLSAYGNGNIEIVIEDSEGNLDWEYYYPEQSNFNQHITLELTKTGTKTYSFLLEGCNTLLDLYEKTGTIALVLKQGKTKIADLTVSKKGTYTKYDSIYSTFEGTFRTSSELEADSETYYSVYYGDEYLTGTNRLFGADVSGLQLVYANFGQYDYDSGTFWFNFDQLFMEVTFTGSTGTATAELYDITAKKVVATSEEVKGIDDENGCKYTFSIPKPATLDDTHTYTLRFTSGGNTIEYYHAFTYDDTVQLPEHYNLQGPFFVGATTVDIRYYNYSMKNVGKELLLEEPLTFVHTATESGTKMKSIDAVVYEDYAWLVSATLTNPLKVGTYQYGDYSRLTVLPTGTVTLGYLNVDEDGAYTITECHNLSSTKAYTGILYGNNGKIGNLKLGYVSTNVLSILNMPEDLTEDSYTVEVRENGVYVGTVHYYVSEDENVAGVVIKGYSIDEGETWETSEIVYQTTAERIYLETYAPGYAYVRYSEDSGFEGVSYQPVRPYYDQYFALSSGNGIKTIYVQFRMTDGTESPVYVWCCEKVAAMADPAIVSAAILVDGKETSLVPYDVDFTLQLTSTSQLTSAYVKFFEGEYEYYEECHLVYAGTSGDDYLFQCELSSGDSPFYYSNFDTVTFYLIDLYGETVDEVSKAITFGERELVLDSWASDWEIYTNQKLFTMTGRATPDAAVTITIEDYNNEDLIVIDTTADEEGNFSAVFSGYGDGDAFCLEFEDSEGLYRFGPYLYVDFTAPVVTSIKATMVENGSGVVTWECDEDNLAYYLLWRDGILIKGAADEYTDTSYIVANAEDEVFDLVAVDKAGNESAKVTVVMGDTESPSAPGTPTLTAHGTKSLSFSWDKATDNVAVYEYWVYAGDGKEPVAKLPYTITEFFVEGLEEGKEYTYSVEARDRAGNVSDAATATFSTATLTIVNFTTMESEYIIDGAEEGVYVDVEPDATDELYDLSGASVKFQYKTGEGDWIDVALSEAWSSGAIYDGVWEIEDLTEGTYLVRFHIVDGDGTEKTTKEQTVVLSYDKEKPEVSMFSPKDGATYGGADINVSINVSAEDNIGVAKIVFSYAKTGNDSFTEIATMTNAAEAAWFDCLYSWDADALADGSYTLRVVAYDLRNNASEPSETHIVIDKTPPVVPTGVGANSTSRYVHIMWNPKYQPSEDFDTFNVYRAESADGKFERVGGGKTVGFFDDGKTAEAGKTYYYYVTATDWYGNESEPSAIVAASLVADNEKPKIETFTPFNGAVLRKDVTLWVSATDNYRLAKAVFEYRLKNGGEWMLLGEDGVTGNTNSAVFEYEWDISKLNGTYEIRVSVYDQSINDVDTENSDFEPNDPAVAVRTVNISPYTLPVAPVVTVTNGFKQAELRWTYGGDTDLLRHFIVYSCDAEGGNLKYLATVSGGSSGSYTAKIAATGKHYFKIVAEDDYGAKAYSAIVVAESLVKDPIAPVAVIMPETLIAAEGVPFTFSASNSTDNDVIKSYAWSFGDGAADSGVEVQHTYAEAGEYTVELTVTDDGGNTHSVEKTITVYDVTGEDAEYALATFTVVDGSKEGTPTISGADVKVYIVDESEQVTFETTMTTNENGQVTAIVPLGENTVSVTANGYAATSRMVRVESSENGVFTHTIGLMPVGVSAVDGSLSYTEMTYDEIIAAGIDVNDPENQHVWKFAATLEFSVGLAAPFELDLTGYFNGNGKFLGGSGWGWGWILNGTDSSGGGGGIGGNGLRLGVFPVSEQFVLVIYGEAHWLKEMYNVELLVINNSYTDDITDCVAKLDLPEGLSLAAMTSGAQTASVDIGTIPAKESEDSTANTKSVNWYVRGDVAGEYNLTATVTGNNPEPFLATFTTDKPLKVYAGSALKMTVIADDYAERGEDYHVTFRLENVSDKSLYNLSFGLTGMEQFKILKIAKNEEKIPLDKVEFGEEYMQSVDELAPGDYIEIDMSTTIWFNSVAEVGELALKTYLDTKGLGFLGNFINVVYYLQNVSVVTLEGSTTTIPTDIQIRRVPRPSLEMFLFEATKGEFEGAISDELGDLAEVYGYGTAFSVAKNAKSVLSLAQGSSEYDVTISVVNGSRDGNTLKNKNISITRGSGTEMVFTAINNDLGDWLEAAFTLTHADTIQITGLEPGETELRIVLESEEKTFEYETTVTVDDTMLETEIGLSPNGNGEFQLSSDAAAEAVNDVREKARQQYEKNPYLWFDSGLDLILSDEGESTEAQLTMESGVLASMMANAVLSYLNVNSDVANLTFDRKALETVTEASGEATAKIFMQVMDTEEIKDKVGDNAPTDAPTYEFLVRAGDTEISQFGGGEVTVQIPYELKDGEHAEDVEIHRVKDDGTYELVPSQYDSETGLVAFATNQFSYYRISISKDDAPDSLWCDPVSVVRYNGKALTPAINVYFGTQLLEVNKDYTISYKNNTNVYAPVDTEEKLAEFEEKLAALDNPKVKTVELNDGTVVTIAKMPQIIIKGKGNFSGTLTKYFVVVPTELKQGDFMVPALSAAYTGKNILPKPVVTWNETSKALKWKTDYEVYLNYNEEAGAGILLQSADAKTAFTDAKTYFLTVVGKGNFAGEIPLSYTITTGTLMNKVKIAGFKSSLPWTEDGATQPELMLTSKVDKETYTLKQGKDYTVTYLNNRVVGTATVVLTGLGDYVGTVTKTFKITGTALSKMKTDTLEPQTYTGEALTPDCGLYYMVDKETKKELSPDAYTIEYSKNIDKGTATILFTGKPEYGYTGTKKATFKINVLPVNEDNVVVNGGAEISVPYVKGGAKPVPVVEVEGIVLTEGVDYTISYKNNTVVPEESTPTNKLPIMTIKFKGNYSGMVTDNFSITKGSLENVTITVSDIVYSPKGFKAPSVTITDVDGKKLSAGKDYDKNMVFTCDGDMLENGAVLSVGDEISVTVTGLGNYADSKKTVTFRVVEASIAKATFKVTNQPYTGREITLTEEDFTTAKCGTNELKLDVDYRILEDTYTNNINKGTASVMVEGIGEYGGTKKVTFKIDAKTMVWHEVKEALFSLFS